MAGLRVIQPPITSAAAVADGAGAGAGAGAAATTAAATDGKAPLLRLMEGERYLPVGLSDADLFGMLPHLMVKGTTVTTRGAAIFAMIALLTRNELLAGRAASFLASVRGKWLDWENVPENYALSFLRLLLRVAPVALTPAEAARVHFLARLGGMAANGRSVLPIRTPFAPAPKSVRPDYKVACPTCVHQRSFTLMAADGRCGLCHADGEAKAKATPEPADTAAGLAAAATAAGAAGAEQPTATLGLSHWCECRACAAQYTVSCPQLMLKGLAPKCHFCRAGGVKAAGGAGKGGKGAKAAAAAAAKKKAAAGADGEEEEVGAGICAPTPCVSCASCGNRFIAAHVASLLQASRRAAAAAAASKAPLAADASAVAAARAVIKSAAAGSGSAAASRKAAGGAGAAATAAAAAADPVDVANAHAAFTCPSCTAAKLGLWSASTLTEENETSVAALARAVPVGGGAAPNWAVLLQAAGLAPAAAAGADDKDKDKDKASSDGFGAAGSAAAAAAAAAVPAALPYDLFAPGAGSVAKTKSLFAPLPGYKMVFPRPDGRLPQGVAASLDEAGMEAGAAPAGDAAAPAVGGAGAAAPIPLLWHKGKPVLNTSALLGDLASWAVSASAQAGECSLCFETVHRGQLASACGRSGCTSRACATCLKAFYSAAAPGALLPPSALCCPFCKRTPTRAAIKTANPALCVLLMSTGGVPPALDPAWHYGWCKTCMLPKQLLEKTCARDAPEPTGWDCGDCIRARRERERLLALNRAFARVEEAAGAAARAANAATAAALAASGDTGAAVMAVRPCPNPKCGVAIYKDGGCDHVTCEACDAHICWRCGETFDDAGACYGHLDDAHGSYFSEDAADPAEFVAAAWMGWRQHQVRTRASEAADGAAIAEVATAARAAAIAAALGGIAPEEAAALQDVAGVDFMQWLAETEGEAAVLARLGALRAGAGGGGDAAGGAGGGGGGAGGAGGR